MRHSHCPQCGASTDLPDQVAVHLCAFCGSHLVDVTGVHGDVVEALVPFELDRQAAADRLARVVQERARIPAPALAALQPDALVQTYTPFWVVEATVRATYQGKVSLSHGSGDHRTTRRFDADGTYVTRHGAHLVSASRGLPERRANRLEPYDLDLAIPLDAALLARAAVVRPDIDRAEALGVAEEELTRETSAHVRKWLPVDRQLIVLGSDPLSVTTAVELGDPRLVHLPVWAAVWEHRGKAVSVLVNGQTGRVVGAAIPGSWSAAGWFLLKLVLLSAVLAMMGLGLLGVLLLGIALGLGVLT